MAEELIADIGKFVVGISPDVLVAIGLGSCIGCVIYDTELKIGGLAHVMLPSSTECQSTKSHFNMNKFADIALPEMAKALRQKGCTAERMVAKIAGGAHLFADTAKELWLDIGHRNEISVKTELGKLGIRLVSHDTGGKFGRTIRFCLETGRMTVKSQGGVLEL